MEKLKTVINWIVWSSVNSDKISATLKLLIPFLVLLNFGDSIMLGTQIDWFVQMLVVVATWITGTLSAWYAIRKLVNTIPLGPRYRK